MALRKGQYGLQVKEFNGGWKWVFCHDTGFNRVITTENYKKALPGSDLDYFQSKFPFKFRSIKIGTEE